MKKLLVFTDIDGTLIDHDSYEWHKASRAIRSLRDSGYPLILNSSKTIAEIEEFQKAIGCADPFISENGSAVYFSELFPAAGITSKVIYLGTSYDEILTSLSDIRQTCSYKFKGFNDMSADEISGLTGLSQEDAIRAKQRHASEPLLWLDNEDELKKFEVLLAEHHLQLTKGGRFYHVMGKADKASASKWLLDLFKKNYPDIEWVSMALGDSYNDIEMLRQADIPVLINNPFIKQPDVSDIKEIVVTKLNGSEAWNQAVLMTIDKIQQG